MRPLDMIVLVVQAAQVAVAAAANVIAMIAFFISVLQLKFRLRWVTVVLYLDPRCDCVDDVILRCLADNEQAVCHMGQGLLSIG
jgi:hypothetical protein